MTARRSGCGPARRHHRTLVAAAAFTAVSLPTLSCTDGTGYAGTGLDPRPGELLIPSNDDWMDRGTIFEQGDPGSWETHLWGGFTVTAVIRDGQLLLYYMGADGFDDAEGTVTFRAVGLATSHDGTPFAKHSGNPVITWTPNDDLEEGIGSAAALLMPDRSIGMYYGALTDAGPELVTADARFATSSDGVSFRDAGTALDHADRTLWGAGDEIFPIIALEHNGRWILYYIPNGTPERARLGVAFGPGPLELTSSGEVLASGSAVPAWGAGAAVQVGPDRYAIFVNTDGDHHATDPHIDAYLLDPSEPEILDGPRSLFSFPNGSRGTVVFDAERDTWLLLHRNADATEYRLRTATAVRAPSSAGSTSVGAPSP